MFGKLKITIAQSSG